MFDHKYKNKKVLITGATGFKGSWLAIWLKMLGADVIGYSLAPKTNRDNFISCNLQDRIYHKNGDIRDLQLLSDFILETQPEIIFHLAAQPIVLQSYKDPVENFEVNMMGTVNIMQAARLSDSVKIIINVTTDKVYKNTEQIWGYREDSVLGGNDPYSASKSCSELITSSFQYSFFQSKGIRSATARAGNVIGGGDWADDRIIPDFFRALESRENLIIRNANSIRPWQHVLESLSGYLQLGTQLMASEEFIGGWNFGPANNFAGHTVGELINEFSLYFPEIKVEVPNEKRPEKEAVLLQLDISKSVRLLNWKPVLDFKDTVKFTIAGYKADLYEEDVYQSRVDQINLYCDLVRELNMTL